MDDLRCFNVVIEVENLKLSLFDEFGYLLQLMGTFFNLEREHF